MPEEITFATERPAAHLTRVRRLPGVRQLVLLQIKRRVEGEVALVARHLLVLVLGLALPRRIQMPLYVPRQLRLVAKHGAAVDAPQLHGIALAHVRPPRLAVGKLFVALVTAVRQARVHCHQMAGELAALRGNQRAVLAVEGLRKGKQS